MADQCARNAMMYISDLVYTYLVHLEDRTSRWIHDNVVWIEHIGQESQIKPDISIAIQ